MLRLYDARAGRQVELTRDGVIDIGPESLVAPYAWAVVADTVRRVADRQRLSVRSSVIVAADEALLLNARFPGRTGTEPQRRGGPRAVTLDVRLDFGGGLDEIRRAGVDPLALRLAFQTTHYRTPRCWQPDDLLSYELTLQRWRDLVAEWAESPSKPMCAEYVARMRDALDNDLDTPTALDVLAELERDPEIPPGSKFESFVHLDELLGLDLAREVGRRPPG